MTADEPKCVFVDGDDHWQTVEELRVDFGIERVKLPNTEVDRASGSGRTQS